MEHRHDKRHILLLHQNWDRIKLHCYYDVAIYEGIKECGGYTVFLHLNTTEEKSVGYTVFLHLNEGRKECGVHCFSPGVGKTRNETGNRAHNYY